MNKDKVNWLCDYWSGKLKNKRGTFLLRLIHLKILFHSIKVIIFMLSKLSSESLVDQSLLVQNNFDNTYSDLKIYPKI